MARFSTGEMLYVATFPALWTWTLHLPVWGAAVLGIGTVLAIRGLQTAAEWYVDRTVAKLRKEIEDETAH